MTRTELIIITTVVLFVAFMLGWFVAWMMHRFTRVTQSDLGELDHMAQQVHEAEEARDAAREHLRRRESELMNKLTQTEAELRAAMEGLRDSRKEAEDLRAQIEREHNG
jgi:type VI protein secretion system component VasK